MTEWTQRLDNPVSARLRDAKTTGYVALVLGALAALIGIPPIEARGVVWSIAIGLEPW